MRKSYVQIDGVLYEKGTEPHRASSRSAPVVFGDLPDFVSPIDGKVVSGRSGMRDHCARHNVVPTADLKGLPACRPEERAARTERVEDIRRIFNQKGY